MKNSNAVFAIGLTLFALFFGAGNLIFPIFMGQDSGMETVPAIIGFLVTGVGLPILGVTAVGFSGDDLHKLASKVNPAYAIIFTVLIYLTIGPAFALPRTATTSFEIGIAPFFDAGMKQTALYVFAAIFFIVSWWFAITPSKLVARVGKIITPLLLLFLIILFGSAFVHPIGSWSLPAPQYATTASALSQGFLNGYNTMDAMAALVFGSIVVKAVRAYGARTNHEVARSTMKAGLIAGACLAIIYCCLAAIGASSVSQFGHLENGAQVLVAVSDFYFGSYGLLVMGVIVTLACLTTSIGLITACSEYFSRLIPKISYRQYATIFTVVSYVIALFGLTTIIKNAIPILMFLYPLTIALMVLSFLDPLFKGRRCVYVCTVLLTLLPAIYDGLHTLQLDLGQLDTFVKAIPLSSYGLGWVNFFVVGFVAGLIIAWFTRKNADADNTAA